MKSLLRQAKYAEAEALARDSLRVLDGIPSPDLWVFGVKCLLADSLLDQQKYAEVDSSLKSAYEILGRREDADTPAGRQHQINILNRLIRLCEATDKREQAVEWKTKLQAIAGTDSK